MGAGNFFCGTDSFSADGFCIPSGVESARTACVTSDLMRSVFDFITASMRRSDRLLPQPPLTLPLDSRTPSRHTQIAIWGQIFGQKWHRSNVSEPLMPAVTADPASPSVRVCGQCVCLFLPLTLTVQLGPRCRLQSASSPDALLGHTACANGFGDEPQIEP